MWSTIIRTENDWTAAVLRLVLGIVVLAHGGQKLFGWFGGAGFTDTLAFFQAIGIPVFIGMLVILAESVGAVALILGFGGRLAAVLVGAIMVGAVLTVHWPFGFFMNWAGNQGGEGFEYHLLVLAITAALAIRGSGALSLDRRLSDTFHGDTATA